MGRERGEREGRPQRQRAPNSPSCTSVRRAERQAWHPAEHGDAHRHAHPGQEADQHRAREEVDEAELEDPREQQQAAAHSATMPASATYFALSGSAMWDSEPERTAAVAARSAATTRREEPKTGEPEHRQQPGAVPR